jgi:hypothetical protein
MMVSDSIADDDAMAADGLRELLGTGQKNGGQARINIRQEFGESLLVIYDFGRRSG